MKLSMITVCFNAELVIEKTILSVLKQSKKVYEYIIIDGDSKDKTMSIVNSYKGIFEEKGIRYIIISEPDKGISDAFNKGIIRASGDIIGLINADDELLVNTNLILDKEYNEKVDVYYGNCIWDEKENSLRYISKPKEKNPQKLSKLLYEMVMIHPATYISKKAYDKYGLYDITFKYCMDEELLYRMVHGKAIFKYIDAEFSVFRAGGVSDVNSKKVFAEVSRIPRQYNEPELKIYMIEHKKIIRDFLARKAKKIGLYKLKILINREKKIE